MSRITIKAVEGRTVFVPGSTVIVPADGMHVEDSSYWQRRIDDGDVLLADKPKPNSSGKPDKDSK